jgi:hypothetical protein
VEQWEEEEGMETMLLRKKKKISIQTSVGNEENGVPVPDSNKAMINVTKENSDTHKKNLKEEIYEKFMAKILDMVNQNVQDALKKFQDTKNEEHEKAEKQINELREDFNKHQGVTRTL